MPRKLIVYIASSLDGYIAGPNDDLSFLSIVEKDGQDYGFAKFLDSVDTVVLGRKTYDWVIKNAGQLSYPTQKVFVITRNKKENSEKVEFYNQDLKELVDNLKSTEGKDIFCDGGAEIVNYFLNNNLVDELVISVVPTLLGQGVRLFQDKKLKHKLNLVSTEQFDTGLVQLKYKIIQQRL
jgi:dihydrofolate reductase